MAALQRPGVVEELMRAQTFHHMAIVYASNRSFKEALVHEKRTFTVYRNVLGEEHQFTVETPPHPCAHACPCAPKAGRSGAPRLNNNTAAACLSSHVRQSNSAAFLKRFTEQAVAESTKLRDLERNALMVRRRWPNGNPCSSPSSAFRCGACAL